MDYEIGYDDDELVGYDDYDLDDDDDDDLDEGDLEALLGARFAPRARRGRGRSRSRRRGRRASPAVRAARIAMAVKRVDQGALVSRRGPTKAREYPIGFDSVTNVAAAATSVLTQNPQVVYRPERLVVPAATAAFFQISDIRVGKNSQLVATGNIPAAIFSENSFGVRLKMDTCQVSQDLIVEAVNFDGAAHRFIAGMVGEAIE